MEADDTILSKLYSRRPWWTKLAVLMALFIAWTGFGFEELIIAFLAAALAATVSEHLSDVTPSPISAGGLARFIPYFLAVSFRGGIDVARRAFLPSMPMAPGFIEYKLEVVPDGSAAAFFASVISLVPGTLCAEFDGQATVVVHVIDMGAGFEKELARLEARVAAIFGEVLDSN